VRIRLGLVGLVVAGGAFALFSGGLADIPVWWLTNAAPPRLSMSGPSGPVSGSIELGVIAEPPGSVHVDSVRVDDRPVATDQTGRLTIDTRGLGDGYHRVNVVAHDTSLRQNIAIASWAFTSDNTPPRLDVALDPLEGPQEGRTGVIRIRTDEPGATLQAVIGDRPLLLQQDPDGSYWALEGVPPDPRSLDLDVRVSGTDAVGNSTEWQTPWHVRPTVFPEDDLDLVPSAEELRVHAIEDAQLNRIYARPNGKKRWVGVFRVPVVGDVTTQFGTHRSYEFHPGMDIAAPLGAIVGAPASGTVVFTGELPARGNTVVLDHGAGVYSTYAHLQRFEVAVGDDVTLGQPIARVGTTGFSTGPHLHWEVWVGGADVDPVEWTRRAFP
jgi:murein DD-endopeptidase MepM/ murein hydrolase activator NlpD